MPPLAKLEKIKRKWYRTNVDKEFDVDYDPDKAAAAGGNANASQGRAGAAPGGARPNNLFEQQFGHDPIYRA